MAHPSRYCRGLGPDGALHGAGHLQIPQGGARGPLLPAGQSSGEPEARLHVDKTFKPWVCSAGLVFDRTLLQAV